MMKRFRESINIKITSITIVMILVGLAAFSLISISLFNDFANETLLLFEDGIDRVSDEYYETYIKSVSDSVKTDVDSTFQELYIIGGIIQEYFDQRENFADLTQVISNHPYFRDNLAYEQGWYQNNDNEPTTVFVEGYLLNPDQTIRDDVQSIIDETAFLDLLLPSFAEFGHDKIQVYYQGGKLKSFARMAPWKDIGNDIYAVYPELNETPIWDNFSPGLVEKWMDLAKESIERGKPLNNLSKVSPPNQDGLTGQIIVTYSYPLFSENYTEFEGSIGFDVSINNIVEKVEGIKLSETGFAFLTLDDGTVFAVNQAGEEVLGLANLKDSTVKAEETSFNVLERKLASSQYDTVKNIDLAANDTVKIDQVNINDIEYVLISKKFDAYLSWTPSKDFFVDAWTLSFLIPKDELFETYNLAKIDVERFYNKMVSELFITAVVLILLTTLVITFYNKRVTSKLQSLSKVANEIAHKNYDVPITIDSTDEVGKLSEAFNMMKREISHQMDRLNVQNEALKNEVNEHMKKDRMIDYLENFDGATNLLNKKALMNILKEVKQQDHSILSSLIIIGLDDFRKVNEAFSFDVGDQVLLLTAERLNDFARNEDLAFKLSGDEFAIFVREYEDYAFIVKYLESLLDIIVQPYVINSKEIRIGATLGVATYPIDTPDPENVFKFAQTAMIHGKEVNNGSYTFYDAKMNKRAFERYEMVNELRKAIERDELFLTYQPIVDGSSKKVTSLEALIRWNSSKFGLVTPNNFIPLAEETKLIIDIGDWVMEKVLEDLVVLDELGYGDIDIAINMSQVQFEEVNILETIESKCKRYGVHPSKLNIEITESILISDMNRVRSVLEDLRNMGMKVSIDDFGTGYSSLSYIQTLPISKIKIDRSFIRQLDEEKGKAITEIIIDLSKTLRIDVVAEGVETKENVDYLVKHGCKELQGYYYAKPMKLEDMKKYLENMR